MGEDALDMQEVLALLAVTDSFGVHRERVSIPLEKAERGTVRRLPSGELEVVAPRDVPLETWLPSLREALLVMGYTLVDEGEEQ